MTILALVTRHDQVPLVVPWARVFALALDTRALVLCCGFARHVHWDADSALCDSLVAEVRDCLAGETNDSCEHDIVDIRVALHPDASRAATELAFNEDMQLLLAAADSNDMLDPRAHPLMRHSPCNTVLLHGARGDRQHGINRILAGSNGGRHDAAALYLAGRVARLSGSEVILGRIERDFGGVGISVGMRDLGRLIRDVGEDNLGEVDCRVLSVEQKVEIASVLDSADLVVVGVNSRHVRTMLAQTRRPLVATIKRVSAFRPLGRRVRSANWQPRLSKSDYTDLYDGLRRGSYLSVDFLVMLGLAAIVASMGLLQDSPAVVIGSMLLAPLMTPMLGCGLALAQANPRLGNRALLSVAIGLLGTLVISALIGWQTPGVELTPQVIARGSPTALDLLVAVASAAAAAYALARPGLVGSIAGVAIATALVPPLCSVGLAIAYQDVTIALGAALLFGTNFVAIVLSAAITFRLIGVRAGADNSHHQLWVRRIGTVMLVTAVLISVPLYNALQRSVLQGKPQPTTYPLPSSVMTRLDAYLDDYPSVDLITAGRPSTSSGGVDVLLFLGSAHSCERVFAQDLVNIVRSEMRDGELVVEIHCIKEMWQVLFD